MLLFTPSLIKAIGRVIQDRKKNNRATKKWENFLEKEKKKKL